MTEDTYEGVENGLGTIYGRQIYSLSP